MDIVKSFTDAFNIYIKNFVVIILATLVAMILSAVTFGILAMPLFVGVMMLFVKAKKGEPVEFMSIFSPIKRFFALFFSSIWISILVLVGLVLLIVPGFIWASWWMFTALFIFDKGMGIGAGMAASKVMVRKNNLWLHLLLIILAGVVGNLGYYVFRIGYLFTCPIAMGAIACAYVDESK
ncbi:MAG: hypothetical protein U9R38_03305 [Candidatus Margulisiibacteriota bacterium]|nr:hypothetical protein [Candidatus Margulisiibacteriota bacterium]